MCQVTLTTGETFDHSDKDSNSTFEVKRMYVHHNGYWSYKEGDQKPKSSIHLKLAKHQGRHNGTRAVLQREMHFPGTVTLPADVKTIIL